MIGDQLLGELVLGGGAAPSAKRARLVKGLRRFLLDVVAAALAEGKVGRAFSVNYMKRPQSAGDLPAVVFEKAGEEREDCLVEPADFGTYRFTVYLWSTEAEEVDELGVAIREAITCDELTDNRFPLFMLGRRVDSAWLDDESDDAAELGDGSDDWLYEKQLSISLIAQE